MNPIEKALATADVIIAENKKLEALSSRQHPSIKVWTVSEFKDALVEHWKQDGQGETSQGWYDSAIALGRRVHARGDGLAIYVNHDLGHPDLGQWQIVSYGGPESQLETRGSRNWINFRHGDDVIPRTLPDIGGRINWRYMLHAVVPSYDQKAFNDPTVSCCNRDAANCDCTEA